MERDDERDTRPTRRDYVKYGGALLAGSVLAGCSSGDSDTTETQGATDSPGATTVGTSGEAATDSGTATETGTPSDQPYTVSMSPVGEVEFESVPENVMVYSLLYADMAVAFGHGDAVNSLGFDSQAGGNTLDAYYERLDGVSFDREGLAQLNTGSDSINVDKELFYELESDLHLVDPCLVLGFDGWSMADIEEVRDSIAPWFGNVLSRAHSPPPETWTGDYEYLSLWEISEKVGAVFQAQERFQALHSVHDEMVSTIQSNLPPESERPSVGAVIFMDGTFYPSKISADGFANAHVRPLQANDAFTGEDVTYETSYGYEGILDVDPDVLLHQYGIASYYDVGQIRQTLADHPVGGELTAVQNDRVYPSGDPVQGPLMNLFQLEMTAKQLYPEQFGEWPEYAAGEPYPEIPADEQLFDRQTVADIVSGTAE